MASLKILVRGFGFILIASLSSTIYASTPEEQVPFDLQQVIEQVTHHPKVDGNTIKINGKYYEARFEEDGIVLKERISQNQLKIHFDEETSNMTIADYEVQYNSADGKFTVKGKNQGLQFRKEITDNRHRFTKDGFRYHFRTEGKEAKINEISVTDAKGNRYMPEVSNKPDGIDIRIPKKVQSKLKFPLTLEGEFMIDTSKFFVPSYGEEFSSDVAFDGTNYFVVWGNDDIEGVLGARVSQTGEVIDKAGIRIAEVYHNWEDDCPAVAFGGGNYLVVWNENEGEPGLFGKRISPSGSILDITPIAISNPEYTGNAWHPSVSSSGSNYLVVWEDGELIFGARVSTSGILLDTIQFLVCNNPWGLNPDVTFGGANYFVVWDDINSVRGTRVNTAGLVLDSLSIIISNAAGNQYFPTVSFGGGNYFVAWQDDRNGYLSDIYGTRVSTAGIVLDTAGIAISTANDEQLTPSVTFDGTNFYVVWEDWSDDGYIYGARINTAGTVLDPTGVRICTTSVAPEEMLPSVAFGGSNYFVVWTDFRFDVDLFGARVNTAGTALDPVGILITMQCNTQLEPKVAFDGSNYLAVWTNQVFYESNYESDIYGARVTSSGLVLDPAGILISNAISAKYNPQVIFGGNNYFVVWDDWRNGDLDIYGSRVTPAGSVLDPNGIPISTAPYGQYYRQVAFSGSNYLIVWEDGRNGSPGYWDVYGARVSTDGVVLDPAGIPISTANLAQMSPQVAFDGVNYFIVWYDSRNSNDDIYGARMSTNGLVLDPAGIPISTAPNWQRYPQISFDNTNYFIVWQDERAGSDSSDIYGARVSTAGVVLDPAGIPISTEVGQQYAPEVIFGGGNYFVVWNDERNNPGQSDIYGARVSISGTVIDPSGIAISTAFREQVNPQVVFDGSNYVVVWEDFRDGYWDSDIYGAKVTTAGAVNEFVVTTMYSLSPALTKGPDNQVFIVWEGWTPLPYNTIRIWGKLIPSPGYTPWIAMNPVPQTPSNKRVKGGGALVATGSSGIFGFKGNNTRDFYCYDVSGRNWTQKESVPDNPEKRKRVKAGAALVYDGNNLIYATKGGNTFEWLSYNISSDSWKHLKPVPSQKGIKGGTGIAKVNKNGTDAIFLLNGSKLRENLLYYPDGDSWQKLPDAPIEFKKGSCAVGYDDSIVYVLKDKYNLFYRVNIQTGTWTLKDTLPLVGILGKKKKIKDGAALAFDGSNTIFAFKGGNTQEFWAYNVMTNNWSESETIPRGLSRKRVKSGGALAYLNGAVYALKGSNTVEFWMHTYAKTPIQLAGQSEMTSTKIESPRFDIFPNPSKGKVTIKYNQVLTKLSRIKIYNVTGALVWETTNELKNNQLNLDLNKLAQGVYILRLENENFKLVHKLLIQK